MFRFNRKKVLENTCLRPPGALAESSFLSACIRCGNCAAVCPQACIISQPYSNGIEPGLPYIDPRIRACNLCMKCGEVCPTGAIKTIPHDREIIIAKVSMGMAVIDERLCISFLGRLCGICRDACPYPGRAIKLNPWARPEIIAGACVGCGLCVRLCPQQPSAIHINVSQKREIV